MFIQEKLHQILMCFVTNLMIKINKSLDILKKLKKLSKLLDFCT
jgi:hypothetical protein